jgi:tetratricopeptide (TPR) repeat protein
MARRAKPRRSYVPPVSTSAAIVPKPDTQFPLVTHAFARRLDDIRKALVSLLTIGLVIIVGSSVVQILRANDLTIDPVGLPKNLTELGYSPEAMATQISNEMRRMSVETSTEKSSIQYRARLQDQDITVPVAGVSFDAALRLLRQSLGIPQRKLKADFVCMADACTSKTVQLRLRLTSSSNETVMLAVPVASTPDEAVILGAEKVLGEEDPVALATYIYNNSKVGTPRRAEAIAVATTMFQNNHPQSQWALNIIGLDFFEKPTKAPEDLKMAMNYFAEAVRRDPKLAIAYINWGACYSALGAYEQAIEKFTIALNLEPKAQLALYNTGVAYNSLGKSAEAIPYLVKAHELVPDDLDTLSALGDSYRLDGKLDLAIETLRKALDINSDYAFGQYGYGMALRAKGDKQGAIAAYQEYLRLIPDASDKAQVETWIAELQK